MIRTSAQDRLYLSQGEEDIYIDNCNIPQHHIEGIRFLYRQFKRKKLGVIINDPFSFGRNIQIILFLKAVRPLLKKPVLILCKEGAEHDWVERFNTWTDLYDEILINVTNPVVKKFIVINTMVNLPLFCRRDWSVLVVDNINHADKEILKLPFNCEFKIWNTPVNMKENLDKFSEIYSWLYPKEVFDKYYFIPNAESAVDVIEKAILLDSFMEDIVIRRDDLNSSFEKYQRDVVMPPPRVTTVVSKKNKDATGTKIKRSKVKADVKEDANKPDNIPKKTPIETVTKFTEETSKICDVTDDFSIDNFEHKHQYENDEYLSEEKYSQYKTFEIDSSDNQNDLKLYYEPDPSSEMGEEKLQEMDTLSYECDLQFRETNINEPTNANKTSESDKDRTTICDKDNDRNIEDTSATTNSTITVQKNKSDDNDDANNSDETKMNLEKLGREISEISPNEIKEQTKNNFTQNQMIEAINDSEVFIKKDELIKTETSDSVTKINYDNSNSFKRNELMKTKNNDNEMKVNELTEPSDTTKVTEQVTNSLKRNNDDDKMKECEEKLTKKFKGSVLDSLF